MGRKKAEPIGQPSEEPPEPTFADLWDSVEPGARMSQGVYSVYKTTEGGMHIAYRPEGDEEDAHMPIPAAMIGMMLAASEGKGPFGRMKALVAGL